MKQIKYTVWVLLILAGLTGCLSLQQRAAELRVAEKSDQMLFEIHQRVMLDTLQQPIVRNIIVQALLSIEQIEREEMNSPFIRAKIRGVYDQMDQDIREQLNSDQATKYDRYRRYRDQKMREEEQSRRRMESENRL